MWDLLYILQKNCWRDTVHSESRRVISIYDIPEADVKRLLTVLQNDLNEYEAIDEDFEPGTKETLQKFVKELQKHTEE
jgi:arsenate reductase-like glutaredoxin family protein